MKSSCVIIPAYEPDRALITIVNSLERLCVEKHVVQLQILIVNDGSSSVSAKAVFDEIKTHHPMIHLIELAKNKGKGEALKTGMAHIESHMPDVEWIVTADADGQHLPEDIFSIAAAGTETNTPVLGVREFDVDIPLKSWIGNNLTCLLFEWIYGGNVTDTQTGLRGFCRTEIPSLLNISAGRYAFELEALIHFTKISGLRQIPITTVYEPSNPSSHFRPILDSMRIYFVLLRHVVLTMVATASEIILFSMFSAFGLSIAFALTSARVIAGTGLFVLARNYIFRSSGNLVIQAVKYILLVGINLFLTIWIVTWLNDSFDGHLVLYLFVAYTVMFIVNFLVQRFIIFPLGKKF